MRELLNTENFTDVVKEKKICIVDFFATWCGPCKKLEPILEKISEDFADDLFVLKVNVNKFDELAATHEITVMPQLIFYLNGEITGHRITGISPGKEEEIRTSIDKILNPHKYM